MLARAQDERPRVVVIGAGMGGLVSSLLMAAAGCAVTVLEKAEGPGGKLRQVRVAGVPIDSGPTVLTLKSVFEGILASVGERLDEHLSLAPLECLARHHWPDGSRLDLFADVDRSAEAIAAFAGQREGYAYRRFVKASADVHATLSASFIEADKPSMAGLVSSAGLSGLPALTRIRAFSSLWSVIGSHFNDPRLVQLFGRYATYCGSSPFEAPGPLLLVAHVEQAGVWHVREGMHALARLLEGLGEARRVTFRYGTAARLIESRDGRVVAVTDADGIRHPCEAVVFNGDPAALGDGLLGPVGRQAARLATRAERSLSALTMSMVARAEGFPLSHHNVFFSGDYSAEFDAIRGRRRLPPDPTVYVCAEDRGADALPAAGAAERLFTIVNAPADGDLGRPTPKEIERCLDATTTKLEAAGLRLFPVDMTVTTPSDFARLFPATGGALYGRSSHGWLASFQRPSTRTPVEGLYLAGGAVHPGPGLPMAALSGRNAARAAIQDLASRLPSRMTATSGGISTR